MDRRSFIVALFGGTAAASVLGAATSQAAALLEPTTTAPAELAAKTLDDVDAEYARHMTWAGHGRRRRRRGSMMRSRPMRRRNYMSTRRSRPMKQGT